MHLRRGLSLYPPYTELSTPSPSCIISLSLVLSTPFRQLCPAEHSWQVISCLCQLKVHHPIQFCFFPDLKYQKAKLKTNVLQTDYKALEGVTAIAQHQ